MKDLIRMNQLAGVITEGQAKKMMHVLNEGMTEDDLSIGEDYDLYFKDKPSWKWFRGVTLSEITEDELIFRREKSNGGWDIDVNKKEFLENGWIKPSSKN
jgi:hypothetical protein